MIPRDILSFRFQLTRLGDDALVRDSLTLNWTCQFETQNCFGLASDIGVFLGEAPLF